MMRTFTLIILSFFSLLPSVSAQWITFNYENTHIDWSATTSMIEASDGTVWIGTDKGLYRFSGIYGLWKAITVDDGLGSNYIYDVKEDFDGNIWVATNGGGVSEVNPSTGSVNTYDVSNSGISSDFVRGIAIDSQNYKWFATYGGGICRMNPFNYSFLCYDQNTGLPGNYFYSAYADHSGKLWFGTNNQGVISFFPSSNPIIHPYTTQDGLVSNSIIDINQRENGDMLFAGLGGVSILSGSSWQNLTVNEGLSDELSYCIMEFGNDSLLIGTDNGLNSFHNGNISPFDPANGLNSPTVFAMLKDSENRLWAGHLGEGVSIFNGQNWFVYYTENAGLPTDRIYGIDEDDNGNIWLGTKEGLVRYNNLSWQTYDIEGLWSSAFYNGNSVNDLVIDGNTIWCLNDHGLAKFDQSTWTTYTTIPGYQDFRGGGVLKMDNHGNLWFPRSYNPRGIVKFNPDNGDFTVFTGLFDSYYYVYDMHIDPNNNVWVASGDGIAMFNGFVWKTYENYVPEDLFEHIECIAGDNYGNTWMAGYSNYGPVEDHGLVTFNGPYPDKMIDSSLHTVSPEDIFFDNHNNLWAGGFTNNNTVLSVFNGQNWSYYHNNDGLPQGHSNDDVYEIFQDSQGNMWVATEEGVSKAEFNNLSVGMVNDTRDHQVLLNFPNPCNLETTFKYELGEYSEVYLEINDVQGRLIDRIELGEKPKGTHLHSYSTRHLTNGVYYYTVKTDHSSQTGKMIIAK